MMKRIAGALVGLVLSVTASFANITCTLPFTLQNNTTADATQVMANYNALVTCFLSAARSGANSDITSLLALSTPLNPSFGGTNVFIGGTASGSANAIIVATTNPNSFALTAGYRVSFIASATNTAATTLNAGGTVATSIFRRTQLGVSALAGGEIVSGQLVEVAYDGTQFQLLTGERINVGSSMDWFGSTAPPGYLFEDGSCVLKTTYADLNTVIGNTYDPTGSTCDVNHIALPDTRGRMLVGKDDQGSNGTAGRITSAGSSCVGTTLGLGCGLQGNTIGANQLPVTNLTFTGLSDTWTSNESNIVRNLTSTANVSVSGGPTIDHGSSQSSTTVQVTPRGNISSFGGGVTLPYLNPVQVATKVIRY